LRASVPLRSALKMAREADLRVVHEVDSAVAPEALPFARVHEVPLAPAGRTGRDVVVAARARKRNTKQKPPNRRIIYKVGLSSHTVFSSQAINASRSATTS
jgi:hypothetical protein